MILAIYCLNLWLIGRGRPQRILLGVWPEEHIKGVVKTVVFRDDKELREDTSIPIPEFDANTVCESVNFIKKNSKN